MHYIKLVETWSRNSHKFNIVHGGEWVHNKDFRLVMHVKSFDMNDETSFVLKINLESKVFITTIFFLENIFLSSLLHINQMEEKQ